VIKDEKILISLFSSMLRIRMLEEKIAELYSEQEMRCPVHLCTGQEAVPAGVCSHLTEEDFVFSGHRSHGHYLAKGGNMKRMLAEIYGKVTGCCKGKGGSMHLIDTSAGFLGSAAIVSGMIPVAVGAALGSKMQNKKNVTVVFFGDAAVEEGVFHESINFAALWKLPVLFACENNLYATYSHIRSRQPDREIYSMVQGYGIDSIQVNGNDVISIYEQTRNALSQIKEDKGPVFMEFKTYRWREHCGPNYDNHIGYRDEKEFWKWENRCPIKRLKKIIIAQQIFTDKDLHYITKEISEEIEAAFTFARESLFPGKEELLDNIYFGESYNE